MRYQEPAHMEFSRKMKGAIDDILLSGVYTNGAYTDLLEKNFKETIGVSGECIAVSSCTSGMMLLLMKDSCRPQISDFTFSATAHSAYYSCLQMQLADIDRYTFNMTPKIHRTADSILATHIFGNPCECSEFERITSDEAIPLFFDGAHAIGATYKGKPVADYGLATAFSLSPTKHVTSGEGGMLVVNDKEWAADLRLMRNYGNEDEYDCFLPGLSARMSEFNAVMGLESIRTYHERQKHRLKLVEEYKRHFDESMMQKVEPQGTSAWKDFSLLVAPSMTKRIKDTLASNDIESKKYFRPISELSCYRRVVEPQPWAHTVYFQIMQLPLHDNMTEEDVRVVSNIVLNVLRG